MLKTFALALAIFAGSASAQTITITVTPQTITHGFQEYKITVPGQTQQPQWFQYNQPAQAAESTAPKPIEPTARPGLTIDCTRGCSFPIGQSDTIPKPVDCKPIVLIAGYTAVTKFGSCKFTYVKDSQ